MFLIVTLSIHANPILFVPTTISLSNHFEDMNSFYQGEHLNLSGKLIRLVVVDILQLHKNWVVE